MNLLNFFGLGSDKTSYKALADLPNYVIVTDNNGQIVWVNNNIYDLFMVSKENVLHVHINDLIENCTQVCKKMLETGEVQVLKIAGLYLELTAKPTTRGLIIEMRDVSKNYKKPEFKPLNFKESVSTFNDDKNTFLVKLSNEFKSPVHSIIGFSQAMIDGLGGKMTDKQEKYVRIINKNSNELLYFLDKILELSKTESELFEYDFQIFDLINSIQSILKNNEQAIKDKNLAVTFSQDDIERRAVFSDEKAFKIILQNILDVSLKSTDIGSILIKAEHPEIDFVLKHGVNIEEYMDKKSFIYLTVTDTGAGIYETDLEVLFDPYKQLDKINKKHIVRSVALSSVKNLTEKIGGKIWVESTPMQGTVFNLILPVEKPKEILEQEAQQRQIEEEKQQSAILKRQQEQMLAEISENNSANEIVDVEEDNIQINESEEINIDNTENGSQNVSFDINIYDDEKED